jgi:Lipase maturation factor
VVPPFLFVPGRVATVAGLLQIAFQLSLILSGNLSFLNWLTLTIAVACLDDRFLARLAPARLRARAAELSRTANPTTAARVVPWLLAGLVALLSIGPIVNMASRHQVMNTSFDPLHLVNTYGAFGSVGRTRNEVILEGTSDENPTADAKWLPYEFPCKPGDPARRPCIAAPYHYRLDWQIWFAAMSSWEEEPWLVHLVAKLLRGDPGALSLLKENPFPGRPPRWIRAERYEYHFTHRGDRAWWTRTRVGPYMPPTSLDDPDLTDFLARYGWAP